MGCMRDVRVRTARTDAMFAPLVETVAVLQKYGIQVRRTEITRRAVNAVMVGLTH